METQKKYAIGIDIGGTNTVIGIVNIHGQIEKQTSIKTKDYPIFEDYISAVKGALMPLVESCGGASLFNGIGVGAPNGNYYSGNIEVAPNLPWKGTVPLAASLSAATGLPTQITNDANAAAIGEMTYGVAHNMKNFIMITLGTGVGSGIVINGQLVYGNDGFAGELGHVTMVREGGRSCGCGREGCLETYASATGVARTAREILAKDDRPSLLRNMEAADITSKDVYDAAIAGDAIAKEIYTFTGRMLGDAFCDFVAFSAPEAIILFGGLTKAGDLLLNPIKERMNEHINILWKNKIKVLVSSIGEGDAAVLGASALAWQI